MQLWNPRRLPAGPIRARTLLPAVLLLLAGCTTAGSLTTPSAPPASSGSPIAAPASVTPGGAATPESSVGPAATSPVVPALAAHPWAAATLTDVTSGESFTIASLGGRTIFVETMAIWCSNCRAQQTRFREALTQLDPDRVAYVVLTVDPSETAEALARYKSERGFVGRYAVAGKGVATALAEAFGPTVLNPPSVPLIRIATDGTIAFSTGGESVEEILRLAGA